MTANTNATASDTVIPAGTYVTMSFNAVQGSFDGSPVLVNGTLCMDYLSTFNADSSSLAALRVRMTFSNFSAAAEGVSFGPPNELALYEFDNQGVGMMTIDGLRITGFDTLTVTNANNYSLANVTLRSAHWAAAEGHRWSVAGRA